METKKLAPEIKDALLEVWEKTQDDGNEHMVVLEPKNLTVAGKADGGPTSVIMPQQCHKNDIPWVVIHSHPGKGGFSLSLQDLCCASSFGGTIFAITDEKMVYVAKSVIDPYTLWAKGVSLGCAQGGEYQHEDNLRLQKLGLIEYAYGKLEA